MMIRVLIVEDEPPVQRNISRKIETIDPSFKVTAVADNGLSAIKIVEEQDIDVMFIDINLPIMNGIEVLAYMKEKEIHVIPIVLSGYKEFEYVKSAFSNNVFDYLLKPLKENDLKILLDRVSQLCKKRKFDEKTQSLEKALTGFVDQSEQPKEFCMVLLTLGCNSYSAGNDKNYGQLFQKMCIYEKLAKIVPMESFWIVDGKNINEKLIFIRKGYDPELSILNQLFDNRGEMPCQLTIVYCREAIELKNVYEMYDNLHEFTKKNMIFMKSASLTYCEEELRTDDDMRRTKKRVDEIISRCCTKGVDSVVDGMRELLDILTARPVSHKAAVFNFRYFMTKLCQDYLGKHEYFEIEDELQFVLENSASVEAMKEELEFLFREQFFADTNGSRDKQLIAKNIKEFLDKNFRTTITNQKLAERFGFVSSYLSAIFKVYYDMTPMDYIIYKRIEEAKQLLMHSGMKVKDVANHLGYEDSLYFSKVFKKETGVSPKEYIKK